MRKTEPIEKKLYTKPNPDYWARGLLVPRILLGQVILLLFLLGLAFNGTGAEAAKAWLENVQARKTNDTLLVNAILRGAFNSDITEAVSSGALTRFRFIIYIKRNRTLWFDKRIREFEIYHTVTFDVLKKEYSVTRSYSDGREENFTTIRWEEMTKWMSELKSVPIPLPSLKNNSQDYFVKIRAEMKCIKIPFPLNYLLVFVSLWNFDTPWVKIYFKENAKEIK